MAGFDQPSYTPMDKGYYGDVPRQNKRTDAEAPLFPIHMIGQTVPTIDPRTQRGIIENVEAAFRGGAGNIQLVSMAAGQFREMGGITSTGEDVREAIREVQKAAGAKITSIELPNRVLNLSGFGQQGFSEEQRKIALDEVRDSIRFLGDIAGGGGVDVISWEFPRNFSDAQWWKGDEKDLFKQRAEEHVMLVNSKTGQLAEPFRKGDIQYLHLDPNNPDPSHPTAKPQAWKWENFEKWAVQEREKGVSTTPQELWLKHTFDIQKKRLQGDKAILIERFHSADDAVREMSQRMETIPEEAQKKKAEARLKEFQLMKEGAQSSLQAIEEQEMEIEERRKQFQPIDKYAIGKSADSYAQAGIWAFQESQKNQYVQQAKGSIYVGPELGQPEYFGGHPREWIQLILESRKQMAAKLVKEEHLDAKEAEQLAKKHIKGEFDTGHLVLWFQNFEQNKPWDTRVKNFKSWMKGQVEEIAKVNKKEDIIGGIQAVDSATGAHGHLPPGQGLLGEDIFEYMKILKEKGGYNGEITSEGHEEERYGQGRILTKAWEAFGSPIGSSYWAGKALPQFRDVRNSYAQIAYGTTGIFQGYVPSNDFSLWSEVPFE